MLDQKSSIEKERKILMRKKLSLVLAVMIAVAALVGCGGLPAHDSSCFDLSREISVISREDGSGTRGAFIELLGILETTPDGRVTDHTTVEANVISSTGGVIGSVAWDTYAIGYISLSSLSDAIKGLEIDGAAPTPANVRSGAYPIARNFHIAIGGEAQGLAADFIDFILSAEGQQVVESRGYVAAVADAPAFNSTNPGGTLVIAGSTSVAPVVERLAEAYAAFNPGADIQVHSQGTTAGITSVIEGVSDIAMSSRELRESELEVLTSIVIAIDGIAIIVNIENPITGISSEMLRGIFTGQIIRWSEVD